MANEEYEGSAADEREDAADARKMGVSRKAYEKTARDKKQDKAGKAKIDAAKRAKEANDTPLRALLNQNGEMYGE